MNLPAQPVPRRSSFTHNSVAVAELLHNSAATRCDPPKGKGHNPGPSGGIAGNLVDVPESKHFFTQRKHVEGPEARIKNGLLNVTPQAREMQPILRRRSSNFITY